MSSYAAEVRPGTPAPQRDDAAVLLAVQLELRVGEQVAARQEGTEVTAAVHAGRRSVARHRAGAARRRMVAPHPRHPRGPDPVTGHLDSHPGRTQRPGAHRPGGRRTSAHRLPELRQEAEGEVPLHARLELPAGEPRPQAPLPGRRHSFLDVLDHLLGRRPAEACQQRRRL